MALTNTFITLETTMTETQGCSCQSYGKRNHGDNIRIDPGNIFDLAGMENVRLQRIQASAIPREMGQGNYSAMVGFDRCRPVIK